MTEASVQNEDTKNAAPDTQVADLTKELAEARARINKYDGERKDISEQNNIIADLKTQVEDLAGKLKEAEDEDTKHLVVTQEELRAFKEAEPERFDKHIKENEARIASEQAEYQKYLATASLQTKDESVFDAVCKEHDLLVANGAMPQSTGNMEADAKIAWTFAENSLLRKKHVAGEAVTGFGNLEDVKIGNTPVIPGQQELGTAKSEVTNTQMPKLPDDAAEFAAAMGMDADAVTRGLKR